MEGVRATMRRLGVPKDTELDWACGLHFAKCNLYSSIADLIMDCLKDWEQFLHFQKIPPLVQAGLLHYQFEAIHPFLDGNGEWGDC